MVSAREARQTVEIPRNDRVCQCILVNGETLMAVSHEKAEQTRLERNTGTAGDWIKSACGAFLYAERDWTVAALRAIIKKEYGFTKPCISNLLY